METPSAAPTAITHRRAAVLTAAAIAALLALGVRWSWAVSPDGHQLRPRPDALEYVAAAQGIAQSGTYFLQIGPAQVRPRYPPGWPLMLAGALRLGVHPESLWRIPGMFAAAQSALLALAAGFFCARLTEEGIRSGQRPARWAPAVAALLAGTGWALGPGAVEIGRTVMSDQPAVFFASIALLATAAWLARSRRRGWALALAGGLAFGVTCGLRPIHGAALVPALAVLLVWGWRRGRVAVPAVGSWALGSLAFPALVAGLLWKSGIPITNWSDYRLWVPHRFSGAAATFSLANAFRGDEQLTTAMVGAVTPHLEIGLRALTGWPGLQGHNYLGTYWPLVGWLCVAPLLGRAARGRPGAGVLAGVVVAVTLTHLAVFSAYFYPAGRFYLLVMVVPTVALAVAVGWLVARPRWGGLATALVLVWLGLMAVQLNVFQSEPRAQWPDETTRAAFRKWAHWSNKKRSQRVMPFDPVHAQALGLFRPAVVGRIRDWGLLAESQHVDALRAAGVLDTEAFRIDRKVTGSEPPAPPRE